MSSETKVISGQSLFDICLREYGTIEAAFDMAMRNSMSITENLSTGQHLSIPDSEDFDIDVMEYYRGRNVNSATGIIPDEPSSGSGFLN